MYSQLSLNQQFAIPRRTLRWARHLSAGAAVFACTVVAQSFDLPSWILALCGIAGGAVVEWLWQRLSKPVTIPMSSEALFLGGQAVAWSEISGMQIGQDGELELIRGRAPFVTIDPRCVENYESLVQTLVRRVRFDPGLLGDSPTVSAETPTLLVPYRIAFDDDGIRLRSLVTWPRVIPIEDIESIELVVGAKLRLRTRVKVRSGVDLDLEAGDADPFEIFENARRAYPHLVT